ncbi:MAG: imelysin family protein, partial [Gammaproteobacteria bacterium]
MSLFIPKSISLALLASCLALPVWADKIYDTNLAIVDQQLIPSYQGLLDSASQYHESISNHCAQGGSLSVPAMRKSWNALADAWMAAEHWRFGPIEAEQGRHSLWFWPDKHGRTGKQLRRFLSAKDMDKLEEARFAKISVALQGLPAAERVLYSEAHVKNLKAGDYVCSFLTTNGKHIQNVAKTVLHEWQAQPDGYRALVAKSQSGDDLYAAPIEV